MAFTIDQYNTLKDAIAQGILKVEYADKKIEYRSVSEMVQVLNLMAKELGLKDNSNGRSTGVYDKGLCSPLDDPDNYFFFY